MTRAPGRRSASHRRRPARRWPHPSSGPRATGWKGRAGSIRARSLGQHVEPGPDIVRLAAAERANRSLALAIAPRIERRRRSSRAGSRAAARLRLQGRRRFGEPVEQEHGPPGGGRSRRGEPAARQPRSVGGSTAIGSTDDAGSSRRRFGGLLVLIRRSIAVGIDQRPGPELDDRQDQAGDRPRARIPPARPATAAQDCEMRLAECQSATSSRRDSRFGPD